MNIIPLLFRLMLSTFCDKVIVLVQILLGLSLLLLMVFILAVISRVNLLNRRVEVIIKYVRDAEEKRLKLEETLKNIQS